MIRKVMNIDSPIRIWLGGSDCVPSACRSSDRTMMIRVKLVIMIRIAGARLRTVSRMMICIAAEKFSRLLTSGRRMVEVLGAAEVDGEGASTENAGFRSLSGRDNWPSSAD